MFLTLAIPFSLSAQKTITIVGTVKSPLEIVTDKGIVYFLSFEKESDDFDELIEKKIKITGMLIEDESSKTIYAKSYEIVK